MEIPMEEDNGYSQQQREEELWEEHKKHLQMLEQLLSEERVISERFNHIFEGFKP